jgi:cold shock CspA family protein
MSSLITGRISIINKEKGWGFINVPDGADHFFFLGDVLKRWDEKNIAVGTRVRFKPYPSNREGMLPIARLLEPETDEANPVAPQEDTPPEDDSSYIPACVSTAFITAVKTEHSEEFEAAVFSLLRMLGIHYLIRFPAKDQAGKSDGFFMVQGLAVIYDCTLQPNFLSGEWGDKTDQISNYVGTLLRGYVEHRETIRMRAEFSDTKKQVWIITRKESGTFQEINGIPIKQIDVADIGRLIQKRLEADCSYKEQQLADDLIALGNMPLKTQR